MLSIFILKCTVDFANTEYLESMVDGLWFLVCGSIQHNSSVRCARVCVLLIAYVPFVQHHLKKENANKCQNASK